MVYILIALSLTTLILVIGIVSMAIGGKIDKKFSSKLMSLRVIFQAFAVCVLAFLYLSK
ncbi:MAG TPA: HIG1 domain-containing protein [Rickettsia endosymbiont of Sericostoma sp.]|uniref:HIG1 domain-containing protein n=1 Tax=unclassified Candidatus Tisiphia TaxID=2996318 RepID=UPI001E09C19C|nr:HIG1 domain-containing protein [Rickettsia endosymbiont of Labidopullus appendiculatus]HJD56756.1 HIG1 domain-containing protein [Rickettsia endosymbiont of Sericostoma sp. HW-2014]HJD64135.1 HIG1 domain-containing protein [Rickettsia endosymbiont of Sericostoma sp.]